MGVFAGAIDLSLQKCSAICERVEQLSEECHCEVVQSTRLKTLMMKFATSGLKLCHLVFSAA